MAKPKLPWYDAALSQIGDATLIYLLLASRLSLSPAAIEEAI